MRVLSCCFLLMLASTEPALRAQGPPDGEMLNLVTADTSAQIGWYGDPSLSEWGEIWQFDWTAGGYGLSMQKSGGSKFAPLGFWQYDTTTKRMVCRGLLDVGGVTCTNTKGDRLCAQVRRKVTEPGMAEDMGNYPGAFCCFGWPDRKRQWAVTLTEGEQWCSAVFSRDDKYVLVFAMRAKQAFLLQLDAGTGKELQRLALPGVTHAGPDSSGHALVATRDGALLIRLTQDGRELDELSLATFQIRKLEGVVDLERVNRMTAARNADVVGFWGSGYAIAQNTKAGWQKLIEGDHIPAFETDFLHSMAVSPDGSRAVVISSSQVKLIDPLNKKVITTSKEGQMGGAFSPDGKLIAFIGGDGTQAWNAADGKALNKTASLTLPHATTEWLRYLPDGKTLLHCDNDAIHLWDTTTRKVRARLIASGHEGACDYKFSPATLIENGTVLVAADGLNFLRWRLPAGGSSPGSTPAEIKSEQAFPGVPRPNTPQGHRWMNSAVDRSGRWMLTVEDRRGSKALLRDLKNPSTVAEVKLPTMMGTSEMVAGPSLKDGEILMAFPLDNQRWLRVQTGVPDAVDQVTSKKVRWGNPIAFMPVLQAAVHEDSNAIRLVSMADGQVIKVLNVGPSLERLGTKVAVSPDEKWVASTGFRKRDGMMQLLVWEVETQALVVAQPLPWLSCEAIAFSADSARIACAHPHHAVSEWDLAKLKVSAKPAASALPPPAVIAPSTPVVSLPAQSKPWREYSGPRMEFIMPKEGRVDGFGVKWQFRAMGTISIADSFSYAGKLLVNDKEVMAKALSIAQYPTCRVFHDTADTECSTNDPRLWVSRYLSRPVELAMLPTFVDTLHNVSTEEVRAKVTFTAPFPRDTQKFIDSQFHDVPVAADGRLQVDPAAVWVAPSQWGKAGERLPIFRFRSRSSPSEAKLFWDDRSKSVCADYEVVLAPGESRHLMHQLFLQDRDPQALPDVFPVSSFPDFSRVVLPVVRDRGVNFGRLPSAFASQGGAAFDEGNGEWAYEPRSKDPAGFVWTGLPGMGVEGALGATSLNLIRIDEKPQFFSGASIYPSAQNSSTVEKLNDPAFREVRSIISKQFLHPALKPLPLATCVSYGMFQITRSPPETTSSGDSLWSDQFYNQSTRPQTLKLSYVSTFRAAPAALWDAAGREVKAAAMPDAVALGGACAIELAGKQRPATLMKFYWEGGAVQPKIRWLSDRILSVDYEFELPPRSKGRLVQLAGQRLLDAGGDLASQITAFDKENIPAQPSFTDPVQPLNFQLPPAK